MSVNKDYRGRISEKIDIHSIVPKDVYDKKNKEKSWHYGEHIKFDINFIVISKDGTLGEIYKVGDLLIGLPSSQGKEIANLNKNPDKAKWKRTPPPEEFNQLWIKYKRDMNRYKTGGKRLEIREQFLEERESLADKHADFIASEHHKREHGMFIKIDEDIHYLTGDNWMFLQHYYLTESNMYPYFRVTAMETFWHWEAVRADTRVWGEIRGKARRTSWSVESASIALNVFTITKYAEIPIVSERKDLAKKLFSGKIVNSFKYYPIYFKPLIELPNDSPKSSLEIIFETDQNENSIIDYYPTKSTAYDSLKVKNVSINDEIGKWENESLTEFIARHSRCHTEGNATGRFGSTAGEYSGGGGAEFEAEFLKADASKRNKIGRTENGLVSLFVDVCYSMTQPISYFDEWGYAIVHDPIEPIKNESGQIIEFGAISDWDITFETLKKQGKKTSLNAFLRDMPRNIEHMFRNEGGKVNDFDMDNLNNHSDFLNQIPEEELNEKIIFRGNLRWEGEKYNSKVVWMPNPRGKFFTTWIPNPEDQNKSVKRLFHGMNIQMPDNVAIGCLGVDSYDIIGAGDGQGSDGAICGYTKFNMLGAPANSFFLTYKERPEKRDDFYDDVIMCCVFFGMFANIESNKSRILEYIKEKGFTGYVLRRQDKKWKDLKEHEREWGGLPSSTEVIADQASLLKDFIVDHVGQNLETDCKVYFLPLIEEWKKFNLSKRKEFDLAVASGFAIMGAQASVRQRKTAQVQEKKGLSFADFSA